MTFRAYSKDQISDIIKHRLKVIRLSCDQLWLVHICVQLLDLNRLLTFCDTTHRFSSMMFLNHWPLNFVLG